ncbi:MAG: hypothetical protein V1760_00710, partial [Candidatus Peregrinibacteria bacterium]
MSSILPTHLELTVETGKQQEPELERFLNRNRALMGSVLKNDIVQSMIEMTEQAGKTGDKKGHQEVALMLITEFADRLKTVLQSLGKLSEISLCDMATRVFLTERLQKEQPPQSSAEASSTEGLQQPDHKIHKNVPRILG